MKLPSPLMTAALASSIASPFVKAQQQCKTGIEVPPSDLQALLPESLPWNDSKSEIYIAGTENSFVTPAESSNFTETATYEEITDFFTRLAAASDYVEVESLETLANGEKLWMVRNNICAKSNTQSNLYYSLFTVASSSGDRFRRTTIQS